MSAASTVSRLADARRRLDTTFTGRFARELIELRVFDRALALASKWFIAVLPLSILSTIGSTIALPRYISHDTDRYGLIGFTFAVVPFLFVASLLLVGATALGAMLDRRARGVEDVPPPPEETD